MNLAYLRAAIVLGTLVISGLGCRQDPCQTYCSATLSCWNDQICALTDEANQRTCEEACNAGLAALSDDGADTVRGCLSCAADELQNKCIDGYSAFYECRDKCGSEPWMTPVSTWSEASYEVIATKEILCDNGRPILGSAECTSEGGPADGGSFCTYACKTSEVSVQVTCIEVPDEEGTCTCDTGKNAGKTFVGNCVSAYYDENLMWDECNP
ncbi:MAG: hypothetical protein IPK82_44260 [Polyangiaceae bacterium]|nr:hypothetical protein [Polyangiaceae bacterium]